MASGCPFLHVALGLPLADLGASGPAVPSPSATPRAEQAFQAGNRGASNGAAGPAHLRLGGLSGPAEPSRRMKAKRQNMFWKVAGGPDCLLRGPALTERLGG